MAEKVRVIISPLEADNIADTGDEEKVMVLLVGEKANLLDFVAALAAANPDDE